MKIKKEKCTKKKVREKLKSENNNTGPSKNFWEVKNCPEKKILLLQNGLIERHRCRELYTTLKLCVNCRFLNTNWKSLPIVNII